MGSSRPHLAPVRYAALALAPLALAACDRATGSSDPSLEGLPTLTLVEEMRLGSVDDPDVGFSRISDVAVADDGRFFVLDGQDVEFRAYSPEGELLHRFGRRGQGPGEFESGPRFGIHGDTLWAIEGFLTARLSLFRLDGELIQTEVADPVVVPLQRGRGTVQPWVMRDDGLFTSFFGSISGMAGYEPPPDVESHPRVPRVLWNAEGEVVDTIGWDATPPPRMVAPPGYESGGIDYVEIAGQRHMVPRPPPALASWVHLPDGLIIVDEPPPTSAEEAVVTVTRIGLESDTIYHRELRYTAVPYTDEDLDSIAARGARGEGLPVYRPGDTPEVPDNVDVIQARLRAELDFPDYRRAISHPWLADDGSVWLRLEDPEPSRSHWVLLDAEGMPRGELDLAPGARPLWNEEDVVWVSEPDELDVPWLVKYRIEGGA